MAMNVAYFDLATSVMNILLNQENYPVPHPTAAQKSRFIKDVLRLLYFNFKFIGSFLYYPYGLKLNSSVVKVLKQKVDFTCYCMCHSGR